MEEMESCVDSNMKENNLNNNQQKKSDFNHSGINFPQITQEEIATLFENNEENLRYYLGLKKALRENRGQDEQCLCDPRDFAMRERLEKLQWRPRVVIRLLDDISSSEDGTFGYSRKQTALDDGDEDDEFDDGVWRQKKDIAGRERKRESNGTSESFSCGVHGCTQVFSSLASYESHYHTCHNFVCAACKRKFVSNFMLDVHIEENHDSYFSILCSRIDMYRCLVESCDQKFRTPELRKDHLVTQHKYPANFSFHKPIKPKSKKSKSTKKPTASTTHKMEDSGLEESSSASSSFVSESTSSSPPPSSSAAAATAMEFETGNQQRASAAEQHGSTGKKSKGNRGGSGGGKKVPSQICFGRGAQRAFQHHGRAGRGRHWHQMGAMDVDTSVDIEKVEFGDMMESLGECT